MEDVETPARSVLHSYAVEQSGFIHNTATVLNTVTSPTLLLLHSHAQAMVGNGNAPACSISVLQSLAHDHISATVSTKVSVHTNISATQYLGSTRPTLVCSCSWVQARPDWRHHLPVKLSLPFITQDGWDPPMLPVPWTPATDPARQTPTNSPADGKTTTPLCCDLISLLHLARNVGAATPKAEGRHLDTRSQHSPAAHAFLDIPDRDKISKASVAQGGVTQQCNRGSSCCSHSSLCAVVVYS